MMQLAGWPIREFTPKQLQEYLDKHTPNIIEISKDHFSTQSTKKIQQVIRAYTKKYPQTIISYAATTNLHTLSGYTQEMYLEYLDIQLAQARFIQAKYLRILIQAPPHTTKPIIDRIQAIQAHAPDFTLAIELHGDWESTRKGLKEIQQRTNAQIVVDTQNILPTQLTAKDIQELAKQQRIAYFHTRNHNGYAEDMHAYELEEELANLTDSYDWLWEPKQLDTQELLTHI